MPLPRFVVLGTAVGACFHRHDGMVLEKMSSCRVVAANWRCRRARRTKFFHKSCHSRSARHQPHTIKNFSCTCGFHKSVKHSTTPTMLAPFASIIPSSLASIRLIRSLIKRCSIHVCLLLAKQQPTTHQSTICHSTVSNPSIASAPPQSLVGSRRIPFRGPCDGSRNTSQMY